MGSTPTPVRQSIPKRKIVASAFLLPSDAVGHARSAFRQFQICDGQFLPGVVPVEPFLNSLLELINGEQTMRKTVKVVQKDRLLDGPNVRYASRIFRSSGDLPFMSHPRSARGP